MGYYIHFLVISFGWNLLCCDATVAVSLINSANRAGTLECRSDGIVNCRTDPNTDLITWVINGTIYATCLPDCLENPSFIRNYTPMYNETKGDLNLTVASVTFNDNNTTFKCDDGSSFDSITIEVVPAYSENKTSINDIDEGKQVEFTTACVKPGVEFEWFTIKTNSSDRKRYKRGQANTTHTLSCSNEFDCGGGGTGKVSSVIIIPTVLNGKESDIEVIVKYKNPDEERTFRFDEVFLIEDESTDNDGGLSTVIVVVITIVPTVIVIACVTCTCIWIKKREKWSCDLCKQSQTKPKNKCIYCEEFICEKCKLEHLKKHSSSAGGEQNRVFNLALNETYTNALKWSYDACKQPQIESKSENKCIHCTEFICNECTQEHLKKHSLIRTIHQQNKSSGDLINVSLAWNDKNSKTHHCLCSCSSKYAESYCIECQTYLCKLCVTKHAGPKHMVLRHCQKEAGGPQFRIFCNICKKNDIKTDKTYYSSKNKLSIVCEDCKPKNRIKGFIAVDDLYFHCEKNVESYCLSCQQYLCSLCFSKHAEHRILRHYQQDGQCHIFCKFCQNMSIITDAKYYSKDDKSFFCEDGKPEIGLEDMTAIDDPKWQCGRCRNNDDDIFNPVECYCLIYDENMCAVCFGKLRKQSVQFPPIKTKLCALHFVSDCQEKTNAPPKLNDVNNTTADVLCLVCNEYLCKMCFEQHLDLKQLWRKQHPVKKNSPSLLTEIPWLTKTRWKKVDSSCKKFNVNDV